MKQVRPLCLASTSPRRRELLKRYGLDFQLYAPHVDERALAGESAAQHVSRLAALKAEAARSRFAGHVILAGDTVVVHEGALLGKPSEPAEAARMLQALSGSTHQVISAYVVLDATSGAATGATVETQVTFRPLPDGWIRWYSRQPEAQDKAGAYGIQGLGGAMVSRIEGSYTNVVGFPVEEILWVLLERGWVTL